MELRQLEHFIAVVEEQQFTRAARRCNLSQSALSSSIKSLERELDAQLLVRTTRRVEPTDAGRALLDKARLILGGVEAAREAVHATRDRLGGSLAVGGITTSGVIDQAKLIAHFRTLHPDVELRYAAGLSLHLIDEVRAGRLDLGIISVPTRTPPGVEVTALASYPSVLVCRPDHRLAGRDVVDPDDLGDETFVGGPSRSVLTSEVARVYRAAQSPRKVTIQVMDLESMFEFVLNGLGVALVPSYLLATPRPPLVAVPLSDPALTWTLGIVTSPPEKQTRATVALVEMIPSFIDQGVARSHA